MALSISAGSSISQSSTALRGGSADLGAQPRAEILVNLGDEGSGDQWRQAGGAPRFIYFANAFPDDPEARARRAAFREAFEKLGWIDGRNIRIDEHWGTLPPGRLRAVAAELVRSAPNVASGTERIREQKNRPARRRGKSHDSARRTVRCA